MRKMYEWRPIADIPKRIQKDCMVVYRYAPSWEWRKDLNKPAHYDFSRNFGNRICTHFMIIHEYKEE